MADRAPRTHVLRLLLRPHDLLEPRHRGDQTSERLDRERIELLEPRDGDARRLWTLLMPNDVIVDLAATENKPADTGRGARVGKDRMERPMRQLLECR